MSLSSAESSVVFSRRMKFIQVWNNLRVNNDRMFSGVSYSFNLSSLRTTDAEDSHAVYTISLSLPIHKTAEKQEIRRSILSCSLGTVRGEEADEDGSDDGDDDDDGEEET